jgi:hypothetical protein
MVGGETPSVRGQKVQLDPMSDIAESYRTIRTAIYFGALEGINDVPRRKDGYGYGYYSYGAYRYGRYGNRSSERGETLEGRTNRARLSARPTTVTGEIVADENGASHDDP